MAWLSRVNFIASDTLSFTDVNNLGNDIRAWGDNVNGGGYTLSNVVVSGSAGTLATISGGSGAASTLTIQSTSGAGTSDAIIFKTASQSEKMRISSNGNVSIGNTNNTYKLDVSGNINSNQGFSLVTPTNSLTQLYMLQVQTGEAGFGMLANDNTLYITNQTGTQSLGYAPMSIAIKYPSGNVGIGTSTVSAKLHVTAGNAATANGQLIISGGRSLGTAMGSAGGILFSNSYWNSGFGAAGIYGGDNGSAGGNLMFATLSTGGGQSGSPSERMRIDSSGNVGIGTTSPAYQLQLSTDSAAKPSTNTWTIASDSRLKTVNGNYDKGLAEICQIRPVRYEYNGKGGFVADGKEQISIIAQELMSVFPECVGTFKGKLSEADTEEIELYNYNGHAITFALINAIKELKAKVDLLESRN